jgi:hypothetical protein
MNSKWVDGVPFVEMRRAGGEADLGVGKEGRGMKSLREERGF